MQAIASLLHAMEEGGFGNETNGALRWAVAAMLETGRIEARRAASMNGHSGSSDEDPSLQPELPVSSPTQAAEPLPEQDIPGSMDHVSDDGETKPSPEEEGSESEESSNEKDVQEGDQASTNGDEFADD